MGDRAYRHIEDRCHRTWMTCVVQPVHPDALCLVAEESGELFGFVTASVTRHAVMPGPGGEIEELYVRACADQSQVRASLAHEAIDWFHERGVGVIWSRVALDAPWTTSEIAFWTGLGFEHDQALLSRYRPDQPFCAITLPLRGDQVGAAIRIGSPINAGGGTVAEGAGHMIHHQPPDLVVAAVRTVIDRL